MKNLLILTFDTETTGLVNSKLPKDHDDQPRICQIGLELSDSHGNIRSAVNLIVNPGVPIPEGASRVHGITDDVAQKCGVAPELAVAMFQFLGGMADLLVAHNLDYDETVLFAEFKRCQRMPDVLQKNKFCTMKATTNICKLPGKYGYKWPKLIEAYKQLVDPKGFEGAHDAMADVRACRELFWKLVEMEKVDLEGLCHKQ